MAKADKQQEVKELLRKAADGARAVFTSENYKKYLLTMSQFHNYSFRNSLLIYLQKPEATYVAGYVAWQKKFNRQVQKGEKGLQIIGYTPKNIKEEQERKDENGNTIYDTDGKPIIDTVTRKIPFFTPVYVYDISQTKGEPLPRLVNELDGSVEAYNDLMTALTDVSPFPVTFEDIKGGANGYCSPAKSKIALRQGMSEAQTVKTFIHEITHADLHAPDLEMVVAKKDRRTKEVEAESTAFIVCNHYGIDTSNYSFAYLASWSSSKDLLELQSSLETIQTQANDLIERIDNRLSELKKDRTIEIETTIQDKPEADEQRFSIYQLNESGKKYRFETLDIYGENEAPTLKNYDKVYEGTLPKDATLDNIFEQFNTDYPADFAGRSVSISDIIVIDDNGDITANFIDRVGFTSIPEFAAEIEKANILRRETETLDSIRFDGDIDLDREKNRKQLGFNDNLSIYNSVQQSEQRSMVDRFKVAKEEAARRHEETAKNVQFEQENDKKSEREER